MINKLGGFVPEYHNEKNLIPFCGRDFSYVISKIKKSGNFFV
jgi:hypothetical protein